jgi:phage FluMu gp28-like protein
MPKFKAAFEDDTIAIPRDADVADDIGAIQVIKGIPKLPDGKTNDAKTRHGDAAISLVMAHAASYDLASEIDWTPAPSKQERDDPDNDYSSLMNKGGAW